MPKFQDAATWQQAEQLMQPVFIRLIDNLRKRLDESTWRGTYEDVPIWPDGVSAEVQAQVIQLRAEQTTANPERSRELEQALADLPDPFPGYVLCLKRQDQQVRVDLWEVCYKICFRDYDAITGTSRSRGFGRPPSQGVEVDKTLFDEFGDVDWDELDDKTRKIVDRIFSELST